MPGRGTRWASQSAGFPYLGCCRQSEQSDAGFACLRCRTWDFAKTRCKIAVSSREFSRVPWLGLQGRLLATEHQDSLVSSTARGRGPESVVLCSTGREVWTVTNSRDSIARLVTNVARTITRIAGKLCFGRHRQNSLVCCRQPRTQPAAMRASALPVETTEKAWQKGTSYSWDLEFVFRGLLSSTRQQ